MLERGWTKNAADLLKLQLLEWVYQATRGASRPTLSTFEVSSHVNPDLIEEAAHALLAEGLIETPDRSMGGIWHDSPQLTAAGQREIGQLKARREDLAKRAVACREAMLDWLYGQKRSGYEPSSSAAFLSSPTAHFLGDAFKPREVSEATVHLLEKGLIHGTPMMNGSIVRPTISTEGESVVEAGGTLTGQPGAGIRQTINTHFHAPVQGQVAIGEGITQSQTLGVSASELDALLTAIRSAAQHLTEEEGERVAAYADAVQAEAVGPEPEHSLIRKLAEKMLHIANAAGNEALKVAVRALIEGQM